VWKKQSNPHPPRTPFILGIISDYPQINGYMTKLGQDTLTLLSCNLIATPQVSDTSSVLSVPDITRAPSLSPSSKTMHALYYYRPMMARKCMVPNDWYDQSYPYPLLDVTIFMVMSSGGAWVLNINNYSICCVM
jgi:hypothetical protein